MQAGGQVATALVTCRRLGLKARYIGKVGDDPGGKLQLESLRQEGVDVSAAKVVRGAPNQYGLIIVDQATGERTIFWDRDPRLRVQPNEVPSAAIPPPACCIWMDAMWRLPWRRHVTLAARAFRCWRTLTPFIRKWRRCFPISII